MFINNIKIYKYVCHFNVKNPKIKKDHGRREADLVLFSSYSICCSLLYATVPRRRTYFLYLRHAVFLLLADLSRQLCITWYFEGKKMQSKLKRRAEWLKSAHTRYNMTCIYILSSRLFLCRNFYPACAQCTCMQYFPF